MEAVLAEIQDLPQGEAYRARDVAGEALASVSPPPSQETRAPEHEEKDVNQAAERIMAWLLNETDMGSWHPNVIASVREAIEKSIAEAREDRDA